MLIILRIIFGAAFVYAVQLLWNNAQANPQTGDLSNAFYISMVVLLALPNAMVWAPYFGAKLSDPLTGVMTNGTFVERKNYLLRLIYALQERGYRRLTLVICFLEGIHYPDRPTAFVIGLKHAKPGSWLEKVFAREVFRFDNAQNCIQAYNALKRHGIDPGIHRNPEINLVLISLHRSVKPEAEKLAVPTAPPPAPLERNPRIRLFAASTPGAVRKGPPDSTDRVGD
jgi:hypothetical protein